ncbi:MAG: corrinoid protein, partial [Lachnospiraceae bacterium]|nr:corrinoid protein [Lachnospiraceae bacterium]
DSTGNNFPKGLEVKDDSKAAFDNLFNAVIKGNIDKITELTNEALKFFTPKACLDDILMPAINKVGDLFNEGRFFLPQLISAANAMKASIEILEPLLQTEGSSEAGAPVVIATVKGDIHDIGKNLVALMLKNCGYRVIDLGKDVDTDVIIEKAREFNADIIALSALMTTTMTEMKNVVIKAKEAGLKAKVIIGGAVTTEEYAVSIEADGYSKDAADCVKLVNAILEENK